MRDVSAKTDNLRTARAIAVITLAPGTVTLLREGRAPKGDPLPVARVAAIQAAKNTPQLIPYCHTVPLDLVAVDFDLGDDRVTISVLVKAVYRTGVEMEALTAAAAAALNIFDMLKPVDDTMEIISVKLLEKTGGKSEHDVSGALRAAVVVVSDSTSAGRRKDRSGAILRAGMEAWGGVVGEPAVVPDEPAAIRAAVLEACESGANFVFTTGGTGLGPRDVTPQAVADLFDQTLHGIEEQLHAYARRQTPMAMLSRVQAGRRGDTIIVCVPGSSGGARDAVAALFPHLKHALTIMRGGCHAG